MAVDTDSSKTGIVDVLTSVLVDVEYKSPDQHGGIYGTIYIMHFGASLPSFLTAGNNIASLHGYSMAVTDSVATNRLSLGGDTYTSAAKNGSLYLTGTSGSNNLATSFGVDWTLSSGWVEYTR